MLGVFGISYTFQENVLHIVHLSIKLFFLRENINPSQKPFLHSYNKHFGVTIFFLQIAHINSYRYKDR